MKKLFNDYHETLIKSLKDPVEAATYLEVALEEGDPHYFLVALRNVADAHGGMSRLSRVAKLNRANLYKMLSKKGRPEIQSIYKVLDALGFKISIQPRNEKSPGSRLKKAA
jgi:probable addiction module antidote protein